MSKIARRLLILSILYGSGIALVWWSTSWKTALGVFILLWALRVEERFDRRERERERICRR